MDGSVRSLGGGSLCLLDPYKRGTALGNGLEIGPKAVGHTIQK